MVNDSNPLPSQLKRFQGWTLVGGIVALIIAVGGAFLDRERFFQSYLFGYLFWLQVALGCLIFLMLHHLAGGCWGFAIRRLLEAGAMTLPLLALLFVPIFFSLPMLYPWAQPEVVQANTLLQHKSLYLNVPFFIGRTLLYFVIWVGSAYLLNRWSAQQDQIADPARLTRRFRSVSGAGLALLGLTATFAAMDWIMSLEPLWYSTMYGFMFGAGAIAAGMAFIIFPAILLARYEPLAGVISDKLLNDLGNFLLAAVMFWAYIAISQYLIIWSGNLPEEVPWYISRSSGGWQWIVILLTAFHFAIPFLLLLSRTLKRQAAALITIAGLVFLGRLIDQFWLIMPAFSPGDFSIHWLDVLTPLGLGGIWLAIFCGQLRQKPLLPVYDPQVEPEITEQARTELPGRSS